MKIPKIVEQNKKSIILLEVSKTTPIDNGAKQTQLSIKGTGFIITNDGKFITCAHVFNQLKPQERELLSVKVSGESDDLGLTRYESYKIEFIDKDDENDVALFKIISDRKDFVPIKNFGNSEKLQEGEEVLFIGYPLALELLVLGFGITMTTNKCIISAIKRRGNDGSLHFFMIDTHTNNGSSGSPLFNVETGEVIGIVSGKISAKIKMQDEKHLDIPANMGLCRPINYAKKLIDKN